MRNTPVISTIDLKTFEQFLDTARASRSRFVDVRCMYGPACMVADENGIPQTVGDVLVTAYDPETLRVYRWQSALHRVETGYARPWQLAYAARDRLEAEGFIVTKGRYDAQQLNDALAIPLERETVKTRTP